MRPRTNHTHNGRKQQGIIVLRKRKHRARKSHQQRPREQHPPPPHLIRHQRQHITDKRIPQQRQRHKSPNLRALIAGYPEENAEDESGATVSDHAEVAAEEDDVDVFVAVVEEGEEAGFVEEPF